MTIRWGVLGPGGIAARFAEAMTMVDGGAVVAVASRDRARAEAFGERFSIPARHGSYDALAEDDSVDAVYVATPHIRHEADTVAMLRAGKHVLCEKPFAMREVQARRMAAVAREHDRFVMEALWSRFLPAYRRIVEIVGEGRIGDVLLVEGDFGFRMPFLPEHRLFARELGGGATLDLGIYPLHLCSLLLGHPDRVVADGTVGETGVDEAMAAVLHHAGGALGVVKASMRMAMSCTARVVGTEGVIELPAFMHCPTALTLRTAAGVEAFDCSWEGDGLRFQIDEVHRCLAEGRCTSTVMPLEETFGLARTMDTILASLGVSHPDL